MRTVFADTVYWIAMARPNDQWREAARNARRRLGRIELVTNDHHFEQEGFTVLMKRNNPPPAHEG